MLDPARDIAFPDSVVQMMKGELGQPPGGWPEAIQREGAEGRGADHCPPRLAASAPPISTPSARPPPRRSGTTPDDRELASYLMYPKVFSDFAAAQESYGPTEVLPTPTYFYGLPAGEEISVELEKGKTLSSAARRSARPTRTARSASSSS